MDTWKIKRKITEGEIYYNVGDYVTVFRRKGNGYPRKLIDGVTYVVIRLWGESVEVLDEGKYLSDRSNNYRSTGYKVHKSFIIQKDTLRELRLEELFKDQE